MAQIVMDPRFELSADEQGRYSFTLKGGDGSTLLVGLKTDGRIPVGIDVLHVRKAVRDIHHFVPHRADDGVFVVLKDSNGAVLGKSPHVPKQALRVLVDAIQEMAPIAGISESHSARHETSSH